MTRDEAIKYLIRPVSTSTVPSKEIEKQLQAYEMAIEALKQTPITHAYWIMGDGTKYDEGRLNIMHCSNCKALFRYQGRKKNINYCYRCGAVMEGIKDAKIHKHR